MAEATRMTQSQIIKELAETCGVNNKVAKQFLETFAEVAVRETKKKGVFILPWNWAAGSSGPQGSHGPQPRDVAKAIKIPGQEGREVSRGEGRERRDRSAESQEVG